MFLSLIPDLAHSLQDETLSIRNCLCKWWGGSGAKLVHRNQTVSLGVFEPLLECLTNVVRVRNGMGGIKRRNGSMKHRLLRVGGKKDRLINK